MLKQYYELAKPGIIYGNVFTALASFLYASRWHFGMEHLLATLMGLGLVIAGSAVINNYTDRTIDQKMSRTRDRALVKGFISVQSALIYSVLLGAIGFALLYFYVNALTTLVALVGVVFYTVLYAIAKRWSYWGAVIGSVSGAVSIVVGYTAVTDKLDGIAALLFLILVLWQLPHFYAIAIRRLDEYKAAGIPVLPAQKGMQVTKIHIVLYIVAFIVAVVAFALGGYAGYTYIVIVLAVSLRWLWLGIKGFKTSDDVAWARSVFLFSLFVLMTFSVMLALTPLLP